LKLVIAPDKFKGCLDAAGVCRAIARGWRSVDATAQIDECPMADGGEGTVSALVAATGGRLIHRRVTGPLADMKVDAAFGILGDNKTAIIEMSAASGLALLKPEDRNPMLTTTFGSGELMCAAVELGVEKIILGIGGSATIDCGIGAAQACGLPVLMEGGEPVSPTEPLVGGDLERVLFIKHGRGSKVDRVIIEAACDVTNPLCGPNGSAAVFGPQKGATPQQVQWFDSQLKRFAEHTGNQAIAHMPGAGAAGGLGFALAAFFGAKLRRGIEIVIEATQLQRRLTGADLCITGEGRLDAQSLSGKTVIGVSHLCKQLGVPCIAIAGAIGDGAQRLIGEGITRYVSISTGLEVSDAIARADPLLANAAASIAQDWQVARAN
jgi:glycerate kinase